MTNENNYDHFLIVILRVQEPTQKKKKKRKRLYNEKYLVL